LQKHFYTYLIVLVMILFTGMGEVHGQDNQNVEITNQAQGVFSEPGGRENVSVSSNLVKVVMESIPEFSLRPNNVVSEYSGNGVEMTHRLTNNGNVASTLDISISNTGNDDFDLQSLQWTGQKQISRPPFQAKNTATTQANGLQTTVTLQPGEEIEFSYSGEISSTEEGELQALLNVEAASQEYDVSYQNVDTVNVLVGTKLDLQKNQINADNLQPGDTFTYQLLGENIGDVNAPGRTVNIDGTDQQKVVLTDPIPANVTFAGYGDFQKGTKLYHTPNQQEFHFSSQPPADLSTVNMVAVAYDSIVVDEQIEASFDVTINDNASGELQNTAEFSYVNPNGSVTTTAASNQVVSTLPEQDPDLNFYEDEEYDKETATSSVGQPLYLESEAARCNEMSGTAEEVIINISSEKTGDKESVGAKETGYNTGVFRVKEPVPTRNGNQHEVVPGNDILETIEKDKLEAVLECEGIDNGGGTSESVTANVVVDPAGVVFDSETNEPVQGTTVRVINTATGQLAATYDMDQQTEVENPQTTGQDGVFKFPFLETGSYRLEVQPPDGYTFSSELNINQLPGDRDLEADGSFGDTFTFDNDPGSGIDFDIPVDPKREGVLFVEKNVDREEAEIGAFLTYTLNIRSEAVNTINNLNIDDTLPFGFKYQKGSAQLDGNSIDDPEGGKGPNLTFDIGDIAPGSSKELTYRVLVGPGAERGNGTNTAIARSDEVIVRTSNQAKVKVEVTGGVFSTKGFIIGKVFQDCNKNGMQDPGEVGIPGVRLYLENGNYVVTDSRGMYTFYGIQPNMHVLKLDNYSLPEGSRLTNLDNRHAGDPSSRFVDLKKGQMHRAEFAVCNCSEGMTAEINKRKEAYNSLGGADLSSSVKKNLRVDGNRSSRGRFNQASGTVGNVKTPDVNSEKSTGQDSTQSKAKADSSKSADSNTNPIQQALLNASPGLGFLNLADGDSLNGNKATLWIKGRANSSFRLTVNGEQIEENKIGQRSVAKAKELQVWQYVSIPFNAGTNTIRVEQLDPFGNVRDSKEITVVAPGELAAINVTVPRNNVNADGQTDALVQVTLTDANGVRIGSKVPITLDTSMGTWNVKDNDEGKSGTQTSVENGIATFALTSTPQPSTATVKAHAGTLVGEATVNFLPDLRPLMAAGIIQGKIQLSDPLNIQPATSADGFERELTSLSYNMNNFRASGRAAFFIKGKVSGKTLLTASYDSEKDTDEPLFRDIQPDEFYPVYGESSIKGFDAQSTSRLYVRLEHEKTYAVYGDFITQERNPDRRLGDYSRAQTGVKAHYEKDRISANIFGSSSVSNRRIRKIQGQGISRYELPDQNIIENSEIIEIVTVDRNQPDVTLNVERLSRFKDYVIEPFSGVITFKSPVPSVDENFNPIFIRATYEVENDDQRYLIGGANGSFDVTDNMTVGANVIRDNNPADNFTMASGNVSIQLAENTRAVGEVAHTRSELDGNGTAERLKVQHRGDNADLTAQIAKSGKNFSNPSSTLGQARIEAKATGRYDLTSSTNLNGEFLLSRNDTTGAQTMGGVLNVQHTFAQNINAELGVRHSQQSGGNQDVTNTNLRSKITADLPFLKGASASAEYEQDLRALDRRLLGLGADYRIDWGRIYARHEFISSTGGRYTLSSGQRQHNTALGFDIDYMENGKVYSEYRLDNGIDGQSGQAAIGVRNRFEISDGFGINAGFERTFTVQGAPTNEGTSITTSADYTANPNWKGTARAEARFTGTTNTYFNSLGYGQKISQDWTFLGKNVISLNTANGVSGLSKIQQRLRLGAAYRDISTNRFDALMRYELKYEEDANIGPDYHRVAHVFSSHANYNPHPDWIISGRLAAKKSIDHQQKLRTESFLQLGSTRLMYEINNRLDASVHGSLLMNQNFTTKDYGVGIEAGYVVAKNLRLAAGFNFFGYDDQDLASNNYTRKGVYAGFSYKFDEQLFKNLIPNGDNIVDESKYQTCKPCAKTLGKTLTLNTDIPTSLPGLAPVNIEARDFAYSLREARPVLPEHIHFANNSTYINQPAARMLDLVSKFLLSNKGEEYSINVTGHTDRKSSYSYNLNLSRRRALAVRSYLVAAGVDPDKLQFKGLSYSDGASEEDRVDMALNRRVELDLNIENWDVRFIPQVEDLQVNNNVPGLPQWDYIFVSRMNAVPQQFNITGDSLNAVHKFMADRLAITLDEYEDINLTLTSTDTAFASQISDKLWAADIESARVTIDASGNNDQVQLGYTNDDQLAIYNQQDDLRLADNELARSMMDNLLTLLKKREDYLLLREPVNNKQVPDRIQFGNGTTNLGSEREAVLSRIGSYLKEFSDITLEISANSTELSDERMQTIQEYLVEWGIPGSRISTTTNENIDNSEIRFDYRDTGNVPQGNTNMQEDDE